MDNSAEEAGGQAVAESREDQPEQITKFMSVAGNSR